jgi:hypothetical protein
MGRAYSKYEIKINSNRDLLSKPEEKGNQEDLAVKGNILKLILEQ